MLEVDQVAVNTVRKQLVEISRIATKLASGITADLVQDAEALGAAAAGDLCDNITAMIVDPEAE